jgi:hypothetical protein
MTMANIIKLEEIRLDLSDPRVKPAEGPLPNGHRRRARNSEHFVMVPLGWLARLNGAFGQTWHLTIVLLYLHWRDNGRPITLANCTVKGDGIPRETKRRALRDLERRGLVRVDWRQRKSPIVQVLIDG